LRILTASIFAVRSPNARPAVLDIHHHVILLGVESEVDAANLSGKTGVAKLMQRSELIASNDVPLCLDLRK
jgi:UV DNA damage repair endonuclease